MLLSHLKNLHFDKDKLFVKTLLVLFQVVAGTQVEFKDFLGHATKI